MYADKTRAYTNIPLPAACKSIALECVFRCCRAEFRTDDSGGKLNLQNVYVLLRRRFGYTLSSITRCTTVLYLSFVFHHEVSDCHCSYYYIV